MGLNLGLYSYQRVIWDICITEHNMTSLKKLAARKNYPFGHTHQQIDAIMANMSVYLLQQH